MKEDYINIFFNKTSSVDRISFTPEQKDLIFKSIKDNNGDPVPACISMRNLGKTCSPEDIFYLSGFIETESWETTPDDRFKNVLEEGWEEVFKRTCIYPSHIMTLYLPYWLRNLALWVRLP